MEKIQSIKAVVTSRKWKDGSFVNQTIEIPKFLSKDFVNYGYGYLVQEAPIEQTITPEAKVKRTRKTKE